MSASDTVKETASSTGWFWPILTLILVVFKLLGHFPHSWWIVFLPMWGPFAVFFGFLVIVFLIAIIAELFKH